MHFASAGVLMFRYMGIPARYVSGFSAELAQGKTVAVPDSAAHAWVEIYLDGYGWYPVDVTPGYSPGENDEPESSDSVGPSDQPSREVDESETPTASASASPSASQPVGQDTTQKTSGFVVFLWGLVRVLEWVASAAAVVVLVWLGQELPKRYRAWRLMDEDANRAAVYGYRCLVRLKKWGGTVPEDAVELAQKAKFSQHILSEEERRAVIKMVDRQRTLILAGLSPVKALAFRYVWGQPEPTKKQEEHDDDTP
jgi:hypothetical protein